MLFVAAASAASSPCAGSSLFFCEDFGAGRDGWVEGRGDPKQFASHKHPWPSNTHKADDAGVLALPEGRAADLGGLAPDAAGGHRDAPFWEKEDQTIAYWIYASAGVVLLVIMLLLCAPAKPEDDDEKRD